MSFTLTIVGWLYQFLVSIWVCGALYFDVGRQSCFGILWMVVWGVFVIMVNVFVQPIFYAVLCFTLVFALILVWWFSQRPSNERDWEPNFSKLCRIKIDGDNVVVKNVRNSYYRSREDYDVNHETRDYRLSELSAAEVLILFWGSSWMSHPMVIFDFGNDRHLCISVEVRYRRGQTYNIFKSLFRQYEIMYVVSDERDAILMRTKFGENQDCYLYRLQLDRESVLQLFREYVGTINRLADSPEWYHGLTDNCTTAIAKQRTEKVDLDVRLFLNGKLDKLLYDRGRLHCQLPFEDLKRQSLINQIANEATNLEFSKMIRRDLPGFGIGK